MCTGSKGKAMGGKGSKGKAMGGMGKKGMGSTGKLAAVAPVFGTHQKPVHGCSPLSSPLSVLVLRPEPLWSITSH